MHGSWRMEFTHSNMAKSGGPYWVELFILEEQDMNVY
jgi:hypothetical protein